MNVLYIKALHIIFVVTWFSALFYLGRLLVYLSETYSKLEPEKTILHKELSLMSIRLLFGISWPSAVLTFIFGFALLYKLFGINIPSWLWVKLCLVLCLLLYQILLHRMVLLQKKQQAKWSSFKYRLWNEVATIFLISIVMLVIVKEEISMLYGILGIVGFSTVLFLAIRLYKKIRHK